MKSAEQIQQYIESELKSIRYPAEPNGLYEPIRYALQAGGKRLRPTLLLATAAALGADMSTAVNQALGIEMYHNFTLLHDDVMDHADVRRGRPTVHVKWNEATAILSGDAMLTMASQLMMKDAGCHAGRIMELFNRTAMEVYEGQQMDMDFEPRMDVTTDEYMKMIRLKTSVLLGCACRIGAIMAGVDENTQQKFYDFAINLGLAFQLQDDYLDTFGNPEIFGKAIGGDILNDKKTWLLISALEQDSANRLRALMSPTENPAEKIEAVRNVYLSLGIDKQCHDLVGLYADKAMEILDSIDIDNGYRELFTHIVKQSATRDR